MSWHTRAFVLIFALNCSSAGVFAQDNSDASVVDLVDECDVLAAHPDDPQRMAEGIPDDRIVPRLAAIACERALKATPAEPRFAFQMGRALLAGGKKKESVTQFRKAADARYSAAWAYLGDALQFGHDGEVNYNKAYDAYRKALDGGFERATPLLSMLIFDKEIFSSEAVNLFYAGDLKGIADLADRAQEGALSRTYAFSFFNRILGDCPNAVTPKSIPAFYKFRYGDTVDAALEASVPVAAQAAAGEFDAQSFLRRHGCDSPVSKQLFRNANEFFSKR
jgi:tetratricopeptide (TPR) repeat protein